MMNSPQTTWFSFTDVCFCVCEMAVMRSGAACTCDTAVGLLDVVEPQRRQVQHLSGLHATAQRLSSAVLRVPLQGWVQRIQRDPRDLRGVGEGVRVSCRALNKREKETPERTFSESL